MTLAAELVGAFIAGGVTSLATFGWLAQRKLKSMLKPVPRASQ
jgi:hypothetical protein